MRDQTFMASTPKGGEVSKVVVCLRILLLLNNIDLLLIFANGGGGGGGGWGWGVKKLVIFCGCHNCMLTNFNKVMVLVMPLVPVSQ